MDEMGAVAAVIGVVAAASAAINLVSSAIGIVAADADARSLIARPADGSSPVNGGVCAPLAARASVIALGFRAACLMAIGAVSAGSVICRALAVSIGARRGTVAPAAGSSLLGPELVGAGKMCV